MRGLQDKVAIVAGAAPGNIGGATALRLAQEGMRVIAADFNEAAAQAVADEIKSAGGSAVARKFDISDEASYRELVDFTAKEFGGLDSLFNVAADLSAGTLGRDGNVMSVPIDVWQHTIDVTLTGYMYGVRHALPLLIERGGGSIVNTSSSSVWMGEPEHVAYQTAKSGLVGLTRHTATLGGKRGVRCNLVAPGMVLTKTALRAPPRNSATRSSQRCGRHASARQRTSRRWWRSCSRTTARTSTARRSSSTAVPT